MGMSLNSGGHITHGLKISMSGKWFNAVGYDVDKESELIDYDNVAKHMPADGSVWVTNNTKYHNAFNGGEENRIHLVACVLDYKFN